MNYNRWMKNLKILNNVFYLTILRVFNYALPLILIPYLVNILDSSIYGHIILAQTVSLFFIVFVNFGFPLSATRQIATNRHDPHKITEIFSSVMSLRFVLLIVSFLVYIFLVSYSEKYNEYIDIYLLSFGAIIGHALFPIWYFQGFEDMKYITTINIFCKLFFTALTFLFVRAPDDFIYVPLFYSLGFVSSGIISLIVIKIVYNQKFSFPTIKDMVFYFLDSLKYFWSRLSSIGYSNSNTLLIGLILPIKYVTYYYIADKVINGILSLITPINDAIYPYLSNKFNSTVFRTSVMITVVASVLASLTIFLLRDFVSILFLKEIVSIFTHLLSILLIVIPITIIYVMLGAPLLLAKGYVREFNNSVIYGFICHLLLLFFIYQYNYRLELEYNSLLFLFVCSLIFSKMILLIIRFYYVVKYDLLKEID